MIAIFIIVIFVVVVIFIVVIVVVMFPEFIAIYIYIVINKINLGAVRMLFDRSNILLSIHLARNLKRIFRLKIMHGDNHDFPDFAVFKKIVT